MVIFVGRRWDSLGAQSSTGSALDEAIGVVQVLGCYIVLSITKKVSATSTSDFVVSHRERVSGPVLQTAEFPGQWAMEGP